ncbi:MAG: PHP domain-containing protein, partial [Chloroflexota bacterium]
MTPGWNKADIHIHTTFSDGLMSPEALVEFAATKTDLRVIAVTDHDTMAGALVAKAYRDTFANDFGHLDVIVGSEITSHEGDILALFIDEDIPHGLSAAETVARIHARGGLAIAAHPYTFAFSLIGIGGMRGVKGLIGQVAFDGVEERNGTPTEFFSNMWTQRRNRG